MNQSRKEGKAVKKYFHILLIIALVGVAIVAEAQGSGDLRNAVGAYKGLMLRCRVLTHQASLSAFSYHFLATESFTCNKTL